MLLHIIHFLLFILQSATGLLEIDSLKTLPKRYGETCDDIQGPVAAKQNDAVIKQNDAEIEMKFISQSPGINIFNLGNFAYQAAAGSGITVWMHDSGINLDHEEFSSTPPDPRITRGKIKWLYPETNHLRNLFGMSFPRPTTDPTGHGTCAADKIVGIKYGVAKGANLKVTPVIDSTVNKYLAAGIKTIVEHIKKDKEAGNLFPVVNLSYGGFNKKKDKRLIETYRAAFKELVALDTVIVVAADNKGHQDTDDYPARFIQEREFQKHMLVVGSVNIHGEPTIRSEQSRLVNIWAPGTVDDDHRITCATKEGTSGATRRDGTSYAAPQVAGLAAYLLSVYKSLRVPGSAAPRVVAKILELAYARSEIGHPSIWNGEAGDDMYDWG